jgi:hypothetical protein
MIEYSVNIVKPLKVVDRLKDNERISNSVFVEKIKFDIRFFVPKNNANRLQLTNKKNAWEYPSVLVCLVFLESMLTVITILLKRWVFYPKMNPIFFWWSINSKRL